MFKSILLLLLGVQFLFAGEAHELATELHYIESYQQGVQTASKEHKLMMLVVVEDGCHWCKKFKRTTLSDTGIKQELQGIVKVLVDRYDDMPEKFESHFFPMVFFIDPQTQNILEKSYGYKTKELFTNIVHKAMKKFNNLEQ